MLWKRVLYGFSVAFFALLSINFNRFSIASIPWRFVAFMSSVMPELKMSNKTLSLPCSTFVFNSASSFKACFISIFFPCFKIILSSLFMSLLVSFRYLRPFRPNKHGPKIDAPLFLDRRKFTTKKKAIKKTDVFFRLFKRRVKITHIIKGLCAFHLFSFPPCLFLPFLHSKLVFP